MAESKYLNCPIDEDFFRKLGKVHSSQIRRALHKEWGMGKRLFYKSLRERLYVFGHVQVSFQPTKHWEKAFYLAEEWNRYAGVKVDQEQFKRELFNGKWLIETGEIEIDPPTWLTLASLAFRNDTEKESPNHRFLKELCRWLMTKMHDPEIIREESYLNLYGDRVRTDLSCTVGTLEVVGEMGGVQLWKVMALLNKGYQVIVIPHWTRQKTNPFIRKKLRFSMFRFSSRRFEHEQYSGIKK